MICDQEFFKWSIQHCSELSLWNHSFNEWFTNFVVFTLIDYSLVYLWSKWLPRWLVNENMLLDKCIMEWNGGSLSSFTVQYKTIGLTLAKCILEWWLTIKLHGSIQNNRLNISRQHSIIAPELLLICTYRKVQMLYRFRYLFSGM